MVKFNIKVVILILLFLGLNNFIIENFARKRRYRGRRAVRGAALGIKTLRTRAKPREGESGSFCC